MALGPPPALGGVGLLHLTMRVGRRCFIVVLLSLTINETKFLCKCLCAIFVSSVKFLCKSFVQLSIFCLFCSFLFLLLCRSSSGY